MLVSLSAISGVKHIVEPGREIGITYDEVDAAFVGYCYGDSTAGQVSNLYCPSRPRAQPVCRGRSTNWG